MTESEIARRLAVRFSPPEYAFLTQVRNGTGYIRKTGRTADALAMSLWPSRGLGLYGFEIKSTRSDWKRELKQPAKAEDICQFCNRWYVVTADESMIEPGELPEQWGWMACRGAGLICKVEAPARQATPLDLPMLCAIFRRVQESTVPYCDVQAKIDKGIETRRQFDARELERLREQIKAFKDASGVCIDHWNSGNIGEAVRLVMATAHISPEARLRSLKESAEYIVQQCEEALSGKKAKKVRRGQV